MKKGTKQALVAGGVAAGAIALVGAIIFWPKKAQAKSLPYALDANLTADQKNDVATTLYSKQNDPAALSVAGWKYHELGAPIAAETLFAQAMSVLRDKLDPGIAQNDYDILLPLYIWTDPIKIQGAGLILQSKNFQKAAAMVMQRAQDLAKLGQLAA